MSRNRAPTRVLVTGAYGLIGSLTFKALTELPDRYEPFGMVRRLHASDRTAEEDLVRIPPDHLRLADVRDTQAVQRAVDGMETVVHLAADHDGNSPWESILENNILGARNVFEACRKAGGRCSCRAVGVR